MSIEESRGGGPRVWFSSSYSNGAGGECVEAAFVSAGVLIRDSKRPQGPHVTVSAEAWCEFLATSVK
ncbi:DUF397 domain-containing protein [Streptomyces sp. NPDC046862]|uniref:DUF397 domain-containing protein n=1 Tax=Streptomyces sp. NPDC046862 TaxID=3154603 RepID=UPI00345519E4